jgi:hypothetical protein
VAYDEVLAERIRELLIDEPDVVEKKMFGGLAFLIGGRLAVAAGQKGDILVRVDPATSDVLANRAGASIAVMRGRPMDGWLRVGSDSLRTRRQLATWVGRGAGRARNIPVNAPRPTRPGPQTPAL